jgi:protein-disulfide isomerase
MPQLRENYISTGKAAYVYMDFPIERWHHLAFQAAQAVQCAADQGQFHEMHDLLLSRQNALQEDSLYAHADVLGLDVSAFQDCMVTNKHAADIKHSIEVGRSLKIKGTPSFFFCVPEPGQPGVVRVLDRTIGVASYPPFERRLEQVLDSTQ